MDGALLVAPSDTEPHRIRPVLPDLLRCRSIGSRFRASSSPARTMLLQELRR